MGTAYPRPSNSGWGQFRNDFSDPLLRGIESHSLAQLIDGTMTGVAPLNEEEWAFVGGYFGFHWIEDASVLFWANVEDLLDPKGRYEIQGGMGRLVESFLTELSTNARVALRPDTPVNGIELSTDDGVLVDIPGQRLRFDAAICAVPAPAVARIDFTPELPSKQVEAIRAVRYFPAVKALAHCKERAWETLDGIFGGSSATDRLHQQCWYPSDNATAEADEDLLVGSGRAIDQVDEEGFPVVVPTKWRAADPDLNGPGVFIAAYVWGANAERIAAMPDPTRQEQLLRSIRRTHPWIDTYLLEPLEVRCWPNEDNPGGGAFAYFEPTEQRRYGPWLCRPHGDRVFFAGEHHGVAQGWIQGAIQSALAAVRGVAALP